jgi:hypothetical protein
MTARPWLLGWALGGIVVLVAAGLLLELIRQGRRITRQARDIEAALLAAQRQTDVVFELMRTNGTLQRMRRALRGEPEEEATTS